MTSQVQKPELFSPRCPELWDTARDGLGHEDMAVFPSIGAQGFGEPCGPDAACPHLWQPDPVTQVKCQALGWPWGSLLSLETPHSYL